MLEILGARKSGEALRPTLRKKLENAKTEIDSIFPISDAVKRKYATLAEAGIVTEPTPIKDVQCGLKGEVVIIGVLRKIAPRDENEAVNVQRRGYEIKDGKTASLNLFAIDDSDEIFCKVNRFDFETLGAPIIERGAPMKHIYAIKGNVPPFFRMISIKNVKYLGAMEEE
jgi:hypothetical protein